MLAKLSESAVAMRSSQSKLSRKREPIPKRNHTMAGRMRPSQKTPTSSVVLCRLSSCASNFHSVEPSSRTSLHQRSPTINLPVTFLTVQKSKARRSTHSTKILTKLEENHVPKMYVKRASVLKQRWKKAGTGCFSPAAISDARESSPRVSTSSTPPPNSMVLDMAHARQGGRSYRRFVCGNGIQPTTLGDPHTTPVVQLILGVCSAEQKD
mmetsp:Transcript_4557/g.10330  ORF Transcript_4557/g.10330 Transcript_4557/m.10330 type:complete len:210 (-) Transcript_4557:43-672(-)